MNRLKKLRKEKNITLNELSDELKIPRSTLSRYENGDSNPSLETWEKISDFFDVSVGYLIGFSELRFDAEKELEISRKIFLDILETKEWAPNMPLEKYAEKAFNYFNNENLDITLKTIVNKFINDHPNPKNPKLLNEIRRINLYSSIVLMYIATAKTNHNLIEYAVNNLPKDIDIDRYNHTSEIIEVDLSSIISEKSTSIPSELTDALTSLSERYSTLTTYDYEAAVDDTLQSEINIILKEARDKILELKQKYPDKSSNVKQTIILAPKDVYGYIDIPKQRKKYSLDKLKLPEDVKKFIIQKTNELIKKNK
ncbi:helix-turn-helix domain-containing protein [Enterococcus sp. DIV0086]|uniref:helix-turn-helix domain-containing protein n=1 Tax=Enterococcus sp. DIV0086 TaxID=2774655 RepID=UPI003D281537